MIPITKIEAGDEEIDAVARVVRSGWIAQGPEVAAFEFEFRIYVGAKFACAVSNCTAALHLALHALGAGPGDEVITVSHTFIATANAIRQTGATPVFVDIDPLTYNMSSNRLDDAITDKTKGIVCVHQMGLPCDLETIVPKARERGLWIVEDAACAIGSEIVWNNEWQRIGRPHGDIACFSFHPRKVMTTGEGGMLTTDRSDLDQQFRLLRQHGMSVNDLQRHRATHLVDESYSGAGYNYRLTDIQAAIGRAQLKRLPTVLANRRALAQRYQRRFRAINDIGLPTEPKYKRSNWQSYCIRLPKEVEQSTVRQALLDQGIATKRGIMCIHREPAYRDQLLRHSLGHSEESQDHGLILPLFPEMSPDQQNTVVEQLQRAISGLRRTRTSHTGNAFQLFDSAAVKRAKKEDVAT